VYTVSELFKQYITKSDREFEVKALVGAITYNNTSVIEFEIDDSVVSSDNFSIGNVITSKLTFQIKTADTIPTNAKITPYVRLNGSGGFTEWVALGSYYIDNRGHQNGVWKFTCYDKLILTQQTFVSALVYPISMQLVFNEIVAQLSLVVDSSVVINPAYMIPYKDLDITIRDMLGYIASAHGASVKMTKDEKLAFVKFLPDAAKTLILASDYFRANETNPLKTYTAVKLIYNTDGEFLTAGSGSADNTLSFYNPFMDQTMLDTIFAAINGLAYTPVNMDWKGRPNIEVGDAITVTRRDGSTFPSIILSNKMSFKGGLRTTSIAPSYSEQRSEFDYKGSLSKQVANAVKLDAPYYGVTIGRANGIKVEKSDGSGKLILNSDTIEMSDEAGAPVLKLDGVTRKLLLSAVVHMLEGSVIDWNAITPPTADQVGAKDINWSPAISDIASLAGYLTHITGEGIYSPTVMAQQLVGALIEGLIIKAGKITGIDDEAILEIGEYGGSIDTHIDGTGQKAMRLKPGKTDVNGGYIQILEDGHVYFYKDDGAGVSFAQINPDGTTDLIARPVIDTAIVYTAGDVGVSITNDGVTEVWEWTKDVDGRITAMASDFGRTLTVTY